MPLMEYLPQKFNRSSLVVIEQANDIARTYSAQGYDLTLRQMYYQFVARDLIANNHKEYKRLGAILNNARNAGLMDWNHMIDRTRNQVSPPAWDSPSQIIRASANQFQRDLWTETNQDYRPQIWVEKDALEGVISRPATQLRVPFLSCRGYVSQSQMWLRGREIQRQILAGHSPVIIHLGDHDPSGIDMTRDIQERLSLYAGAYVDVRRIALTMDQVEELQPPPNPAKLSDSRAEDYVREYGDDSWELDALEPSYIDNLVREAVDPLVNSDAWEEGLAAEAAERERMKEVARRWVDIDEQWDDIEIVLNTP
jgi:hypothetical protein